MAARAERAFDVAGAAWWGDINDLSAFLELLTSGADDADQRRNPSRHQWMGPAGQISRGQQPESQLGPPHELAPAHGEHDPISRDGGDLVGHHRSDAKSRSQSMRMKPCRRSHSRSGAGTPTARNGDKFDHRAPLSHRRASGRDRLRTGGATRHRSRAAVRLDRAGKRVSVVAIDMETGEEVWFGKWEVDLTAEHLLT